MKNFASRLLLAFFLLVPVAAFAQSTGTVVADCTTGVGLAYTPGSTRPMTLLPTGQACVSTTGGGGGGLSVTDQAAWTQGSSSFTPGGGVFNDTATLSSGQQGTFRMTTKRAQIVDVDTSGNALYTALTASVPAGTNLIGDVNLRQGGTALSITNPIFVSADPCQNAAKTTAAFSSSSGGPVSIVALSGSTKVYICAIAAITDTAIKLSFIDGTGGSCASAQHALIGSTTAANGMSLAANGGFTLGSGNGTVAVTAAASAFCFLQSGTSLVAGTVSYVQQ